MGLQLNVGAINSSLKKEKRASHFTGEREGQFDKEAVVVVTATTNQIKFPKGETRKLLGIDAGSAMHVFAGEIMPSLTKDVIVANFPAEVVEGLIFYTGEEVYNLVKNKTLFPNLSDEPRGTLLSYYEANLENNVEYLFVNAVGKKNIPQELTYEQFKALPKIGTKAAEALGYSQSDYTEKGEKGSKRYVANGIVSVDGIVSTFLWETLGGDNKAYAEETCDNIVSAETIEKYRAAHKRGELIPDVYATKVVYRICNIGLDYLSGTKAATEIFLLYAPEREVNISKKTLGKLTNKEKAVVSKVTVSETDLEENI